MREFRILNNNFHREYKSFFLHFYEGRQHSCVPLLMLSFIYSVKIGGTSESASFYFSNRFLLSISFISKK